MMQKLFFCLSLLAAILAGTTSSVVYAQLDPRAVVIHTSGQPGTDSFELNVLFTLLDGSGRPLPKDSVKNFESAQIQLPTGAAADATIQEANMPVKIALVIDASGSMVRRIEPVKDAAIKFVNAAPANARIAVFKFSEEFEMVQNFTGRDGLPAIESSIRAITTRAPNTGDTCVYKAAFEAINALDAAKSAHEQERQTVVLFTDGIDRESGGQNCGSSVEGDVINKAQAVRPLPVQVHTIGLCAPTDCSNINSAGLRNLADQTLGATAVGKVEELESLFATIVSALNNQWLAQAKVMPVKGLNTATVRVKVNVSGAPVNLSFPTNDFTADRDYGTPPAAVTIAGLYQDTEKNAYKVKLNITTPEVVKQISWKVRDESANTTLYENSVDNISATTEITHPFDVLKEGQRFCTDITAVDINGMPIPDAEGKTTYAICGQHTIDRSPLDFEFALPPTFDWETGTFEIKLHKVQSAEDVTLLYEGAITEGTVPVMQIPQGVLGPDFTIKVPLESGVVQTARNAQQPKEFTIDLTLTDQVANVQQNKQKTTTVVPPERPSWLQRLGVVLGTPLVLASVLAIVVLVAGVVAVTSLRRNRRAAATPQPLYTGQTVLGADDAKQKPATSPMATSDREPVKRQEPRSSLPTNAPERLQPQPAVGPPPIAAQTEIGPSDTQSQLRINVVATLDPALNHGAVIRAFPCVIGRENSSFLIHGDKKVSRQHIEITMDSERIVIKDLGSANGTALVTPLPGGSAMFTEKQRIAKGGSAVWDQQSLIRLGPNTVLELKPHRSFEPGGTRTVMLDDDDDRTQMLA